MAQESYGLDMKGPLYLEAVNTTLENPTSCERRIVYDPNLNRVRYSNGTQWVDVEYIQPEDVTFVPRIVVHFSNPTQLTSSHIGKAVYFNKNSNRIELASATSQDTLAQGILWQFNASDDHYVLISGLCNKFQNLQIGHIYCLYLNGEIIDITDNDTRSLPYIQILLYSTHNAGGLVFPYHIISNQIRKTDPSLLPVTEKAVSDVIANAPDILDTLQEIADAINNDPDFYKSVYHRTSSVIKYRLLACTDTYGMDSIPYADDQYIIFKTNGLYGVDNPPTYIDSSPSDTFIENNKDIIIPTIGLADQRYKKKRTDYIQRDFIFYGNFIQNTGANNRDMIYYAIQSLFSWHLQNAKIVELRSGVFDENFTIDTKIKVRNLTKNEDLSNEFLLEEYNPINGLNDNTLSLIGNRIIDTNDRIGIILTEGYDPSNFDSRTLTVSLKFEILD